MRLGSELGVLPNGAGLPSPRTHGRSCFPDPFAVGQGHVTSSSLSLSFRVGNSEALR